MPGTVELAGSRRPAPEGGTVGELDPRHQVVVTLYLQDPAIDAREIAGTTDLTIPHRLSRRTLARRRSGQYAHAARVIAKFAAGHGLVMRRRSLARRCVILRGTAALIGKAFGTSLHLCDDGRRQYRVRSGPLYVPRDIAPFTRAVLGLDQRPQAEHRLRSFAGAGAGPGLWPSDIARLYDIPPDRDGAGQCVGIIALGGGYLASDLAAVAAHMGRPPPVVIDQPVGDAGNAFAGGDPADQEIALDLQVLYGIAPAASIVVYFAASDTGSLVAALHQAVHDDKNRPQVVAISWGSSERTWTEGARAAAQAALGDAKDLRVSVVAASGDSLATGGLTGRGANVFFPASSPWVLGCGGTLPTLDAGAAKITAEAAWNDGFAGTGGGISDVFPIPDYQQSVPLPPSVNDGGRRRGVPDVAGAAAPTPGYRIILDGQPITRDGTSAVAPLWAALIALANAERGRPLGLLHPLLYANPALCRPITAGDNRAAGLGYDAGRPWNACTGLGVPRGGDIIAAGSAMV
jgi:kumamolisin